MKLVRLEKVTATEIKKLAKGAQALAANATYGNRSGAQDRARAIAMTEALAIVAKAGKALEVTALCTANGDANEYHIAHRASRPAESRVGVSVKVHMFTVVTKETATYIEGYTQTSKGHGRVFVELA
jgi:outer membrane phospholipase A